MRLAGASSDRSRLLRLAANLWVQPIDLGVCGISGTWGCRFLTVTYRPIVAKVWDAKSFVDLRGGAATNTKSLAAIEPASLRGRVLRFAFLAGSELFNVDLLGADLQNAEMADVVLRHADLWGAQLQGAILVRAQLQGALLWEAHLQGANLSIAQLQGADLSDAQLQGAELSDAQLQGAVLDGAQLQGADLRKAALWNVVADTSTQISLSDFRGWPSMHRTRKRARKYLPICANTLGGELWRAWHRP